jgi:hypothetical protein
MDEKPHWIDFPHQVVSNGRWHAMWFLIIENLLLDHVVIDANGLID